MDRVALRTIAGLLLYGDSDSPDLVAHDLVARADPQMWALLVGTIHSEEELPVRIRCLEVLAKSASLGSDETAQQVLAALSGERHRTPAAVKSGARGRSTDVS